MYKTCPCATHEGERLLPLSAFFKHKTRPDGLSHSCKACHKRQVQIAREANIEQARAGARASYYRHKDKRLTKQKEQYALTRSDDDVVRFQMLHNAKQRARKHGLDFSLVIEDIVIPDVCPVFETPLVRSTGTATDQSPTLDRIDSSRGYTRNNVIVISKRANTIKNSGTPDEHRRIYEFFSHHQTSAD